MAEIDLAAERELEAAVRGLYHTFAPVEADSEDSRTSVLAADLDVPRFKRLLPRLLESAATTPAWADLETPVLLRKLADAGWNTWSVDESASVSRFLEAVWRAVLLRDSAAWRASDWLSAIGGAVDSLQPYLEVWCHLAAEQPTALRQLAEFVRVEGVSAARRKRLVNVWWRQRPAQAAEVLAWLRSDAPRTVLAAGYLAHETESWATDVSEAEWVLGWLQQEAGT